MTMKPVSDILYLAPEELLGRIRRELDEAGAKPQRGVRGADWLVLPSARRTVQLHVLPVGDEAFARAREHYYSFLVVDSRRLPEAPREERSGTFAQELTEKLHYTADPDRRFPLSRVIAVLEPDEDLPLRAFELGRLHIGGFVVEPFGGALLDLVERLTDPHPGKAAICLAGGGVEGFIFEVGVLMALNAHLQSRSVTDANIYCGISAGAILAAFIANGAEPEEVAAAITDPNADSTVQAVRPSVIYDPHFKEYASRAWLLAKSLPIRSWSELVSAVLKTVPMGFFSGDSLERFIREQLVQPGRTDDFRQLKRELYIGATDQDTSAHVVFGKGQWQDVPISTAVRASAALTPFFDPVQIRGRYFVDGQYTRTSNFHLAVERGAKLVIVVDPLVPVRTDVPGYVAKKGGVFGGLQALKAVIHTRFFHAYQNAVDSYPQVDFLLFKPEEDDMRLMSGSPMKYNIRTEILNMAYRCAVRRIQRDFEKLEGIFAHHGFRLQRHPRLRGLHQRMT
ncbi:MAG: patatin-like phospholipase family protein [Deltaproteobacteria bacterium]|nr:patatin-like phospholipase family protein [Deltaproteobacteria bacterium]